MELNAVLFPAPSIKYTPQDVEGDVLYIPRFYKYSVPYRKHLKKQYLEQQRKKQIQELKNPLSHRTDHLQEHPPFSARYAHMKDVNPVEVETVPDPQHFTNQDRADKEFDKEMDGFHGGPKFGGAKDEIKASQTQQELSQPLMSRQEVEAPMLHRSNSKGQAVNETVSKLDLSEIQEENPVCKPSKGLQTTERAIQQQNQQNPASEQSGKSEGFIKSMKNSYISKMAEKVRKENIAKQQQMQYERQKVFNFEKFNLKWDKKRISHYIPCMHIPFHIGASKVMIYFHANAEDIVLAHELLDYIRTLLRVHIIAVEYPGYGLYNEELQKRPNTLYNAKFNVNQETAPNTPDLLQFSDPGRQKEYSQSEIQRQRQNTKDQQGSQIGNQAVNFERVGSDVRETFRKVKETNPNNDKKEDKDKAADNKKDKENNDDFNASISSDDENLNDKINPATFRQEAKQSQHLKNSVTQMYNLDPMNTNISISSDEEQEEKKSQANTKKQQKNKKKKKNEEEFIYEHNQFTPFDTNEENILEDALYVYDYVNKVLGIEESNIIIFGRSMGSGPACHVASLRKPGCLLLMSAFKSIRAIAEDQAGRLLKYLIQDRFKNIDKIKKVTSPTFMVHGMQDNLISYKHSKELHDNCSGPCSLILPPRMNHNDFDFCEDLITPFYHFLKQMGMSTREPKHAFTQMAIPDKYFRIPKAYLQKSIKMNWGCCYVSVNNPQNANQSFQNAASSYFDDNEVIDPANEDVENTFCQKDVEEGFEHGEFTVPVTLEQLDQQLGPNASLNKKTNSVVKMQKEGKEGQTMVGGAGGGLVHAFSVDMVEQEEDQMLIMQYQEEMLKQEQHGGGNPYGGGRFSKETADGPQARLQSRQVNSSTLIPGRQESVAASTYNTKQQAPQSITHNSNHFKNPRGSVVSRISAQSTMKDGENSGFVGGPNTSPNKKSFSNAFKGATAGAAKNVKRQKENSPERQSEQHNQSLKDA